MSHRMHGLALLLGRVVVGTVFVAHGWQKFAGMGLEATAEFFQQVGVPAAEVAAVAAALVEVSGGFALILGALLPVAGVLLAADMFGAIWFVHGELGFWASEGGYEFVLVLAAASIALGFSGGGVWALDRVALRRRLAGSD